MREELRTYLKENGVKQIHIANILGVTEAMVSMYLNQNKNFGEKRQKQLREFLDSKK